MSVRARHLTVLAVLAVWSFAPAQTVETDFPDYTTGTQVMTATPGTQGGAVGAYWNPAAWAAMQGHEIALTWNDQDISPKRMDNWGLHVGGRGLGFVMRRNNFLGAPMLASDSETLRQRARRVDDYQIAIGGGNRGEYWGLSYGWSKGDTEAMSRDHYLALGNISRPSRALSIGNSVALGLGEGDFRGITDLGIRPFSTHHLTFFADAAYTENDNPSTMHWGVGAEIMPIHGVRLAGKLTKPSGRDQDKIYSLSLGFTVGGEGFHLVPHYDRDSERLSTSYMVRVGDLSPSFPLVRVMDDESRIVSLTMRGRLTYQKSRWLDRDKITLMEMLEVLERAASDDEIDGVALNLSGFVASREMTWELREKLVDLQKRGKQVYIYMDRAGMTLYYLASVADFLWIDPQGSIAMPGLVAGRTFWKGFLEKIGLGVEEWRFMAYKSAFEMLSRREMSDADREQRLELISDFYEEWSGAIAASRNLDSEELDSRVDSMGFIFAGEALEVGLVDAVGRWDDAVDYVEEAGGKSAQFVTRDEAMESRFADPSWGMYPQIALVYAIGDCDMETGIRGRYTSRLLRKLAKRDEIRAVVLRVDSPGGDPLPSDLVACEMETVAEQKPMVVSQGSVAASGGYWISMTADRIYTSPFTVTGSIGVIAGWIWNDGLTDKTGFTSDFVKVGEHADLGFGVRLPFLGVMVPDRNLDAYERARMEHLMKTLYHDFMDRVSSTRGIERETVEEIAQGRVWSGRRSVENRLTDEIGGLEQAIGHARHLAGIKAKRKIRIIEYPSPGLFNFDELFRPSSPIGALLWGWGSRDDELPVSHREYELSVLRRISESPAQPLLLTPSEDLPPEEDE